MKKYRLLVSCFNLKPRVVYSWYESEQAYCYTEGEYSWSFTEKQLKEMPKGWIEEVEERSIKEIAQSIYDETNKLIKLLGKDEIL